MNLSIIGIPPLTLKRFKKRGLMIFKNIMKTITNNFQWGKGGRIRWWEMGVGNWIASPT